MLLKTQRTASSAYVRWSKEHSRSHEFAWLDPGREMLLMGGGDLVIQPESLIHSSVQKMMATMELNPYERELQYGFPYLIGQSGGIKFRAPLLTIPISIAADGGRLIVNLSDDSPRFNSLPFRTESDTSARELAFARLMEESPDLPLSSNTLRYFCESVARELDVKIGGRLNGDICGAPAEPRRQTPLTIVDHAACFIAPKTSYFLVSDLEAIGGLDGSSVASTSLGWLIGKRPPEPTNNPLPNVRKVFFPFPSNPSQRRVAHLVDDPKARITVVQGPPGTGKSLTIANLACHLIAKGKRVLITSQKDKALQVVDETLRHLELAQLPMTLLRKDRDSRKLLRDRLESIQKQRSSEESRQTLDEHQRAHETALEAQAREEESLRLALKAEHEIETADQLLRIAPGRLSRIIAKWKVHRSIYKGERTAQQRSDILGESLSSTRERLRDLANGLLEHAAEHRVNAALKTERNHLREFARLLGRDQTNYRNFRVFDKLKAEPERCQMLLNILPCWIMTPDDVARLFPCSPSLFDVVIIDEASQCDLPSMVPVLYRACQAVVVGDSKQMQAQRFAFTSGVVATQAWAQYGLDKLDPERWLDPARVDLLQLASMRMDEEAFLDEHYRSLPSIIGFSNERWYGGRLRIMRDVDDRRLGDPTIPAVSLHRVSGRVTPGTQENEREARALVKLLRELLEHPAYSDASFGVICLFEQQMHLINDLVSEEIPDELRASHNLVVVNPDGFQGDERDIMIYSLSYGPGMEKDQLSARQADRPHIQGMLNVAFTRARDEVHIFHSADISDFGMSSGAGSIKDWLEYCRRCEQEHPADFKTLAGQLPKAQSEFEQHVLTALAEQGFEVISQFPACGYFIDIVARSGNDRVAIECDGEFWHLDEHGEQKIEDIERQEVLERAGWRVLRIPYRSWRENPQLQVARIAAELRSGNDPEQNSDSDIPVSNDGHSIRTIAVDNHEMAIINAMREGVRSRAYIYRMARETLGYGSLGSVIRTMLDDAVERLEKKEAIAVEEDEIFFRSQGMRDSTYSESLPAPLRPEKTQKKKFYSRRYNRRRW